jgi:hypothetical protein
MEGLVQLSYIILENGQIIMLILESIKILEIKKKSRPSLLFIFDTYPLNVKKHLDFLVFKSAVKILVKV